MKGKITIEASDHSYGIDCNLDDVSMLDKFELMHALATVIHMDDEEMHLYLIAEKLGIMEDEGITIDMTELRRQLNES